MTNNDPFAPLTSLEMLNSKDSRNEGNKDENWIPLLPVPSDVPPPPKTHSKLGLPGETYKYRDWQGNVCYQRCRFDSGSEKAVLPLTYGVLKGRIGWHWTQCLAILDGGGWPEGFPLPRPAAHGDYGTGGGGNVGRGTDGARRTHVAAHA